MRASPPEISSCSVPGNNRKPAKTSVLPHGMNQHLTKRREHAMHLRLLIGKNINRIDRMHDHAAVHFKNKQRSVCTLCAIDPQIIKSYPFVDLPECVTVPDCKIRIEVTHEARFF